MTRFPLVGEQRSQALLVMNGDSSPRPPVARAPDAIGAPLSLCAPLLSELENPQIHENAIVKLQTWAGNKCLSKP